MDEAKRKKIEAKLNRLFAQADQTKKDASPAKRSGGGTRVIRRRKGKPDLHIPLENDETVPKKNRSPAAGLSATRSLP